MEKVNATEAKREFGDLLIKVQQEPIRINKNGKPVAVMISAKEYDEAEEYKAYLLEVALKEALDDIENGGVISGEEVFRGLREDIKKFRKK